jgi:lipoprotein-releasing system ATP-binding protein
MSEILQAVNLHKTYENGESAIEVLRGIDLVVEEAALLAVLGQSGAGKSTLLHLLGALDTPTAGEVRHRGSNLFALSGPVLADKRNKTFGFVFQFYHLLPDFTALENVQMPAMVGLSWLGWQSVKGRMRARASELLARVGLAGREKHRPNQLSGGERQRVAIARALMNDPEILLFDEPTGNLDSKTSEGIQDLIWELNRTQKKTVILVTHEAALAERADRIIRIRDGRILDGA